MKTMRLFCFMIISLTILALLSTTEAVVGYYARHTHGGGGAFVIIGSNAPNLRRILATSSRSTRSTCQIVRPSSTPASDVMGLGEETTIENDSFNRGNREQEQQTPFTAEKSWRFRDKWQVHYIDEGKGSGPPLLLLPGFGVGTFHFDRNIDALKNHTHVYSLDLLGQGKSWPDVPPEPKDELVYGVDTWRDQIADFLKEVVQQPCYIAGNSLGGYLALYVHALYPELVKGIILLNATPFWAFNPPRSPFIWDGKLPAPRGPFKIGSFYFDFMRSHATVKKMLDSVYVNKRAVDEQLVDNIIAGTRRGATTQNYGVGGHEAFSSILFAPKANLAFEEMLARVHRRNTPMTLIYGKDDPWVTPYWGRRIKRQLPEVKYYELSPAGHCPHHETPNTVNILIKGWINHIEQGIPAPLEEEEMKQQTTEDNDVSAMAAADGQPAADRSGGGGGGGGGVHTLRVNEHGDVKVEAHLVDGRPHSTMQCMDALLWKLDHLMRFDHYNDALEDDWKSNSEGGGDDYNDDDVSNSTRQTGEQCGALGDLEEVKAWPIE